MESKQSATPVEGPMRDSKDVEWFFRYYEIPFDSDKVAGRRIPLLWLFRRNLREEGLEDAVAGGSQEISREDDKASLTFRKVRSCLEKAYADLFAEGPSGLVPGPASCGGASSGCSSCGSSCG